MEEIDLKKQLERQLNFLKRSCEIFDCGNEDEAIRIATTLRTLFRDVNSNSLITMLGQKDDILLLSSIETVEESSGVCNIIPVYYLPVMITSDGQKPFLENTSKKTLLHIDEWKNEEIIMIDGEPLTREDVIQVTANKDGGAHVAVKPNTKLKLLRKSQGKLSISDGGRVIEKNLTNIHFIILRQIAFEVLSSRSLYDLNGIKYVPEVVPKSYYECLDEASELFKVGRHYQAIELCKKAVNIRPDFAEIAYNNMGTSLAAIGAKEEAQMAFEKAVELNPNYIDPLYNLTNVHFKEMRYDLVIELCDKIISIDSNNARVRDKYVAVVDMLMTECDFDFQIENVFPFSSNLSYLHYLGVGLLRRSRFSDALRVMEKALKISDGDIGVLSNVAMIHLKVNELEKAYQEFKLLSELEISKHADIMINIIEYSLIYNRLNTIDLCQKYAPDIGDDYKSLALVEMFEILYHAGYDEGFDLETAKSRFKNKYVGMSVDYDFCDLREWGDLRKNPGLVSMISFFEQLLRHA